MRVLCSSVLVFEAIVAGLFIPVAYYSGIVAHGSAAAWIGAVLAVLCIVAVALLSRPFGVALGWLVQVLLLACGFVVPMMFALGLIFGALWWAALRYGRRADAARATHADPQAES